MIGCFCGFVDGSGRLGLLFIIGMTTVYVHSLLLFLDFLHSFLLVQLVYYSASLRKVRGRENGILPIYIYALLVLFWKVLKTRREAVASLRGMGMEMDGG